MSMSGDLKARISMSGDLKDRMYMSGDRSDLVHMSSADLTTLGFDLRDLVHISMLSGCVDRKSKLCDSLLTSAFIKRY